MAWPSEAGAVAFVHGRPSKRRPWRRRSRCLPPVPFKRRWYADYAANWRVFNDTAYRFYRRKGAPPKEDQAPFATSSSLPDTPTATFDDGIWYLAVSYFNGVLDSGFLPVGINGEPYAKIEISGGNEYATRPRSPFGLRLSREASGVVRVIGFYGQGDSDRAGEWSIAYTTNGSDPATDSPDVTVTMTRGGVQILSYALPTQSDGTTVKVRVQVRRNDGTVISPVWVYSAESYVLTTTADAEAPSGVLGLGRWIGLEPESL